MFYSVLKFLKYKIFASHKYGHGIHSPFLYDFIVNVLNDRKTYPEYVELEFAIKNLEKTNILIEPSNYGAKSTNQKKRLIQDILKTSSVPLKYRKLLFRMVQYYMPETILELGTCLGVSTSYLDEANKNSKILSIEAHEKYVNVANKLLESLNIKNVKIFKDTFENALPSIVNDNIDFVFFDGNHTYEPTIRYFNHCLKSKKGNTIFVFDDIYWSRQMNEAWKYVVNNSEARLTVDLFRFGIIFFNDNIFTKQHYVIRF